MPPACVFLSLLFIMIRRTYPRSAAAMAERPRNGLKVTLGEPDLVFKFMIKSYICQHSRSSGDSMMDTGYTVPGSVPNG